MQELQAGLQVGEGEEEGMSNVSKAARHRNESRYRGAGRCWATPPEIFGPLDAEFHFTLDPCATPASAKCVKFYTESDNGLSKDWSGEVVFMNPPYGAEIRPWIKKAKESAAFGAVVVGLLPAETDSDWWHESVMGHSEIRFLRKRPRFIVHMEDGSTKWASPFRPSVVVVWSNP